MVEFTQIAQIYSASLSQKPAEYWMGFGRNRERCIMLELKEADPRKRRILRRGLLSAASLLCLAVPHGPLWAQTYEEPPTAPPTTPAPPDTVESKEVTVPPKTPSYFLSTYRSYLYAPLPSKIWMQGGIPAVIQQSEQFRNKQGKVGNYNVPGATITANNAFFQSLGQNGRSCVTCHNPPSGLGLSLLNIKARFRSNLNDPLFAPVDGANCPDAVPAQYTSGSLFGGNQGQGQEGTQAGLLAAADPRPDPYPDQGAGRCPVYTVEVISDAAGLQHRNATFGQDPVTGEKILSMYRRPILSANLRLQVAEPCTDSNTVNDPPTNVMWDGREPSLRTQAVDATLGPCAGAQSVDELPKWIRSSTSRPSSSAAQIIDNAGAPAGRQRCVRWTRQLSF